jgi:hypothetical protein
MALIFKRQANVQQAAEKDPYASSLRSIASRQRTADVRLRSPLFRAPRLWIFLNSLQESFSLMLF